MTAVGFWGPRTASVDWCEPNYTKLPFVAEFWNTLSSFPIIAAGVMGVYNAMKYNYKMRFLCPSLSMIFVGIGSIVFHGSLKYWGQALDELSMVYGVSCFLFAVAETDEKVKRPWLAPLLFLYNIGFTLVYAILPTYFTFFVITFILMSCLTVGLSVRLYRETTDQRMKILFWVGLGLFVASFFLMWIPDNLLCRHVGFLQLHAWFHLCVSISPYWFTVFIIDRFYQNRLREAKTSRQLHAMKGIPQQGSSSGGSAVTGNITSSTMGLTGQQQQQQQQHHEAMSQSVGEPTAPSLDPLRSPNSSSSASIRPSSSTGTIGSSNITSQSTGVASVEPPSNESVVIEVPTLQLATSLYTCIAPYVQLDRKRID